MSQGTDALREKITYSIANSKNTMVIAIIIVVISITIFVTVFSLSPRDTIIC